MHVDWSTLGGIAVVSAAAALTLVVLVACALVASSGPRVPDSGDDAPAGARTPGGAAVAALCLLAAGLVLGYGVLLIVA